MEVFENHTFVAHWERSAVLEFAEPEVAVDEGGTATVAVRGGSAERATSVQVYLSYQTASAADLDLKNAVVNGVTPKGGLRFPLTLSWAAGEIGVRMLAIPVKQDKALEDDEAFTLQLADARGMPLGAVRACTVTIRDATEKTLPASVTLPLAYAYEVAGDQPGTVALRFGTNGAVAAAGTFATGVDAEKREVVAKASARRPSYRRTGTGTSSSCTSRRGGVPGPRAVPRARVGRGGGRGGCCV